MLVSGLACVAADMSMNLAPLALAVELDGKFTSASTISSPWPIDDSAHSRSAGRMRGIPFKGGIAEATSKVRRKEHSDTSLDECWARS